MKRRLALLLFTFFLAPSFALAHAASLPDKLRVLAVDLQNSRVETPGTPGSELSQDLRRLLETADVDVVCVQGAIDWENCERICQLRPGLQVLTCSAFTNTPQVAILARAGAALAWVDETDDGGGFALSIVQAGPRKLALFSAQSGKPASLTPAGSTTPAIVERIAAEVRKLKKFPQNRPDSFLVAGAGMTKTTLLTDNGFQTVGAEPAIENAPEFWVTNAGFLTRPRSVTLKGLGSAATICDFDTSSSFSSKFAYQTPLLFPGETLASLQAAQAASQAVPPAGAPHRTLIIVLSGTVLFLVLCLFLARPRRAATSMQLVPVMPQNALTGGNEQLRSSLLAWIKTAFVQRLISQRQQLLTNEAEATRRTMVIEEKLSNLQSALQTRISAYEARIDRLEQELTAATLDNRELIRAQIELLKEKVAKAKQEHALGRN